MATPDRPEPSMDEILASIRKIIAEEPGAPGDAPASGPAGAPAVAPASALAVPAPQADLSDFLEPSPPKPAPAPAAAPTRPPWRFERPIAPAKAAEPSLDAARVASGLPSILDTILSNAGRDPAAANLVGAAPALPAVQPAPRTLQPPPGATDFGAVVPGEHLNGGAAAAALARPAPESPSPAPPPPGGLRARVKAIEPTLAPPVPAPAPVAPPPPAPSAAAPASPPAPIPAPAAAPAPEPPKPEPAKPEPVAAEPLPAPEPAPSPAPETVAPAPIAHRTLEDAVAEMLRPMLRDWLDANLPRIVEAAVKVELAKKPLP